MTTLQPTTMKLLSAMTVVLLCLMSLSPAQAYRTAKKQMMIHDQGLAEDHRLFLVICENRKRVEVTERWEMPDEKFNVSDENATVPAGYKEAKLIDVCAFPHGMSVEGTCKSNWNVETAAKFACSKAAK